MAPALREEHAMYPSTQRIEERPTYPPRSADGPSTLQVRALYRGTVIGTRLLGDAPTSRRFGSRRAAMREASYLIGTSPGADAPAASEIVGRDELPLVSRWGAGFLVNVTPGMTGDVAVGGKVYKLADYLAGRGHNFELPANGRARIDCGAMSFCLDHTERAERLPRRWFTWRWSENKFTLGSVLALGLFVLMIFAIPPEGMSVSGDLERMSRMVIPFTVAAPKPEDIPEILKQKANQGAGEAGKLAAGDPGKLGDKTSKKTNGKAAVKGDGKDMHVGAPMTADQIRNTGLLGVITSAMNSKFAGIFGYDTAVGSAKEDILGNLIGTEFANAYGSGGLGPMGSGAGGGGEGQLTMGPSLHFGTVGPGYGHGPGVGALARREIKRLPSITTGIVTTRGSLDKEIIRRVVRLHMNEVKYCYDKELVTKPRLEGRISVQFVISPVGQVISSVLNSSTMNNLRVEKCVVDAVKRWGFPKPTGGGIAIVAYPFNFVAGADG
jgi:hypothetical protein